MAPADLAARRLLAQGLAGEPFRTPADAVRALGAIQAQDFLGGLWAVGVRTRGATEGDVERAIAAREIVRTWPMRGTLHFVAAEDARWMLDLLAERAARAAAGRHRALGLDGEAFAKSRRALERALQGGRRLTRPEVYATLDGAGISTAGQRGIHVLQQLAHEGFLVFAARDGKQLTFALFDEWLPKARALPRDEALARLAERYFTGHGPATLDDFTWWTKLTIGDARAGLAAATGLVRETVNGRELWSAANGRDAGGAGSTRVRLLPPFDELLVGYRERTASLAPEHVPHVHALLSPTIVADGRVVGTWTRKLAKDAVVVTPRWFDAPSRALVRAVAEAADAYAAFLGRRAAVEGVARAVTAPGSGPRAAARRAGTPRPRAPRTPR